MRKNCSYNNHPELFDNEYKFILGNLVKFFLGTNNTGADFYPQLFYSGGISLACSLSHLFVSETNISCFSCATNQRNIQLMESSCYGLRKNI